MPDKTQIDTLVIINVSSEQVGKLSDALVKKKFYFTHIHSSGSILRITTDSLLIGINRVRYDELMQVIHKCCKRRREYIPAQMETQLHHSQPIVIEAETGGATIQTVAVEHFEQF